MPEGRRRARDCARLYGPVLGELEKRGATSDEERLTRAWLMGVLALDGLDPTLRAELTKQAIAFTGFGTDGQLHRDKIDANLRQHRACVLRRRTPSRVLPQTWLRD